MFLFT